jgi:hypothetical protein
MAIGREVIVVGPTQASTLIRQVVAVMAAFAIVTGALVASARDLPAVAAADAPASAIPSPGQERPGPPDLVLILTDDQRFDTLWAMPTVQRELIGHGVRFTNAFVSNPVCCPSRSTILTGQYSHTTGVYTNDPNQPHGGFPAFRDRSTLATWLQDGG